MRVVFMGTPDFAVPILRAAMPGNEIVAVYSQPPRPSGRGHRTTPSPVHQVAEGLGIPVLTPTSLKNAAEQERFRGLNADIAVVAAYGLILPKPILDAPRCGCVNIHASLLPRWRGAAPIQRAILAGDSESGVCLMKMDEGLDTGPVFARQSTPIHEATAAGDLHDALAEIGAALIDAWLGKIGDGTAVPHPQEPGGVTYAGKIDRGETRIDWREPARQVVRRINAFAPAPGAWTELGKDRVKILAAQVIAGDGAPGTVLSDQLAVACGDGAIKIERLQVAGRQPLDAKAFLAGRTVATGARFD
jgi:methionyl-tRNA formyltransferase